MAEFGMIAERAKAESHRANAVAFQLTQTNLNPKIPNRSPPKISIRQRVITAANSLTGPHHAVDADVSLRSKCAI
jgi:hypothetical protein